ncbi:hypothetical protein ACNJX9_21455 [Bradyrhizobium sp. DASA03076]|uniref:hypothetical protein n=1 Tax=Bradyrhizobium sp. BLXBL-03 TaxID=3395916 RepID=UPI003F6EDC05
MVRPGARSPDKNRAGPRAFDCQKYRRPAVIVDRIPRQQSMADSEIPSRSTGLNEGNERGRQPDHEKAERKRRPYAYIGPQQCCDDRAEDPEKDDYRRPPRTQVWRHAMD